MSEGGYFLLQCQSGAGWGNRGGCCDPVPDDSLAGRFSAPLLLLCSLTGSEGGSWEQESPLTSHFCRGGGSGMPKKPESGAGFGCGLKHRSVQACCLVLMQDTRADSVAGQNGA